MSFLSLLKKALHELTFGEEDFTALLTKEREEQVLTLFLKAKSQSPTAPQHDLLRKTLQQCFPHQILRERTFEKLYFHFARRLGLLGEI